MRTLEVVPKHSVREVSAQVPSIPPLSHRVIAEALGTCMLLAAVVGSGIMAERLSEGNVGLALLANSLATGAALVAIILALGPISGAHLNPAVTVAEVLRDAMDRRAAFAYVLFQLVGAFAGVILAHAMFGTPLLEPSSHARAGFPQFLSEVVAAFGLIAVIRGCSRSRPDAVPFAVGLYIMAAYWFTASTSFANPAVTLARTLTNTFTGIRPMDAPAFIVAQLMGASGAALLFRWFDRTSPS